MDLVLSINLSLDDHDLLRQGGKYVSANGDESFEQCVRSFCRKQNLPYPEYFVSVAASVGNPSVYLHGYGDVVAYLKVEVLEGRGVVGAPDDFRNHAVNGRAEAVVLEGDLANRVAAVRELARTSRVYAEIRVPRPITLDDIERFDTSGSFEANLRSSVDGE